MCLKKHTSDTHISMVHSNIFISSRNVSKWRRSNLEVPIPSNGPGSRLAQDHVTMVFCPQGREEVPWDHRRQPMCPKLIRAYQNLSTVNVVESLVERCADFKKSYLGESFLSLNRAVSGNFFSKVLVNLKKRRYFLLSFFSRYNTND